MASRSLVRVASRSLTPSGIAIARSKWHCDRSLRVALQSLAVLDFRRLHGSIHLGMGEDFSVKQQSELQKNLGADHRFFAFDAEVNGRMTGGRPWRATDKQRLSANRPKSGLWRSILARQILSLGPLILLSSSEDHYCTMVWQKIRSVSHFLQPPVIDKASKVKRKNVRKLKAWRLARKTKSSLHHDHFRAKYR